MRKRDVTYLTDPRDRAAAAEEMLLHRLAGASIRALMDEFRCSRATVFRRLAEARRGGFLERCREIVLGRLLLKALAAYDVALDAGSAPAVPGGDRWSTALGAQIVEVSFSPRPWAGWGEGCGWGGYGRASSWTAAYSPGVILQLSMSHTGAQYQYHPYWYSVWVSARPRTRRMRAHARGGASSFDARAKLSSSV